MTCFPLLDLNVALAEPIDVATVRVRWSVDAKPAFTTTRSFERQQS